MTRSAMGRSSARSLHHRIGAAAGALTEAVLQVLSTATVAELSMLAGPGQKDDSATAMVRWLRH